MNIQFKRLDHVLITVPFGQREAAREFYTQVIGIREIEGNHPNHALWFEIGGIELHITEEDKPSKLYAHHPAFEIENLKDAIVHLERHGVEVSYSSKIEGRERFFIRDPFGNRIEFIEFD